MESLNHVVANIPNNEAGRIFKERMQFISVVTGENIVGLWSAFPNPRDSLF